MIAARGLFRFSLLKNVQYFHTTSTCAMPKRWKEKSELPFQSDLKNPVEEVYGGSEMWPDDEVGILKQD
jgi:hypothetical protein